MLSHSSLLPGSIHLSALVHLAYVPQEQKSQQRHNVWCVVPCFLLPLPCLLRWLEFGAGSAPIGTADAAISHHGIPGSASPWALSYEHNYYYYYVINHNNHHQNQCCSLPHFRLLQQQSKNPTVSQLILNNQLSQKTQKQGASRQKCHIKGCSHTTPCSCAIPLHTAPLCNTCSFFHPFQLPLPC